jgi:phytoene dehydrogenase-like protein
MQHDLFGDITFDGIKGIIRSLPVIWQLRSYLKPTMGQYADRFTDPFLRRGFSLSEYSYPQIPLLLHLIKHAYGAQGGIAWPASGSAEFAKSIEQRYRDLGGQIYYGHKVAKILTEGDRAAGVVLDDGTEHRSDYIISDADGRKTICDLLEVRFMNDRIRKYAEEPDDETNWAVHVFLGVNRDLSKEPSSLVMLLDEPVEIAGRICHSIDMQIYGFDPSMSPPGKGVIKVELFSTYSYWKQLAADRQRYEEEKQRVADTVIDLLERQYFTGLRSQVEVVDVPTLLTWEHFMGGTHGFANMPRKRPSFVQSLSGRGLEITLPGLNHFYQVGDWATSAGALFMNALSGRKVMEIICKEEGKKFTSQ